MRDFAKGFYKSQAWKKCREAYARSAGGLCERCRERGIVRAGEIVHHKIHVEPDTISDPHVLLDWSNLELVCRECHAELHGAKEGRRYRLDEMGRVIIGGQA